MIKLIKDLTVKEHASICNRCEDCKNCPLYHLHTGECKLKNEIYYDEAIDVDRAIRSVVFDLDWFDNKTHFISDLKERFPNIIIENYTYQDAYEEANFIVYIDEGVAKLDVCYSLSEDKEDQDHYCYVDVQELIYVLRHNLEDKFNNAACDSLEHACKFIEEVKNSIKDGFTKYKILVETLLKDLGHHKLRVC